MVNNDETSNEQQQQQSSSLELNNKDVVDDGADNGDVQKRSGTTIKNMSVTGAATATTTAAKNVVKAVKQHAESLSSDVLSSVKDNEDIVVDDYDDDDNGNVLKGSGTTTKMKNAANAAHSVVKAVKQEVNALGHDVISDVKDARNIIKQHAAESFGYNVLPSVKDNNKDVVVVEDDDDNDDDNDDDHDVQKGNGKTRKMKNAVHAAHNVAMALKEEVSSIGHDVVSDVQDASNIVLQQQSHQYNTNNYNNRASTNRFSMFKRNPSKMQFNKNNDHNPDHKPLPMDMFDKTASALLSSVVIYAIADIRTLIRKYRNEIIGSNEMINELMTLPIEDVNIMVIVLQNIPLLQEKMKPGEIDFYLTAIQRAGKELKKKAELKLKQSLEIVHYNHLGISQPPLSTPMTGAIDKFIDRQKQQQQIQQQIQQQQLSDDTDEPPISTPIMETNTTPPHKNKYNNNRRQNRRSIYDTQQITNNNPLAILTPRTIEVFSDENSATELVYAITIKRDITEILVSFRGSVTSKDWLMDGKMFLTSVPNPIFDCDNNNPDNKFSIPQSKTIGIHTGFYEYLFGIKKKNDITKYQQIINHLHRLIEKEPTIRDYSINVTGHSLGGALAIIFSFFLVFEKDLTVSNKVSCINFASPKSGNIQFAKAYQELELQKKIICLRVANHKDIITERPDRLTCWTFCFTDAIFRHVGIELLLYPERLPDENETQQQTFFRKYICKKRPPQTHRITYPRIRRSRLSQLTDDLLVSLYHTFQCTASVTYGCCIHDYMNTHSCNEYLNRVETSTTILQNIPMQHMFEAYHNIVSEESQNFTAFLRSNPKEKDNNNVNKSSTLNSENYNEDLLKDNNFKNIENSENEEVSTLNSENINEDLLKDINFRNIENSENEEVIIFYEELEEGKRLEI